MIVSGLQSELDAGLQAIDSQLEIDNDDNDNVRDDPQSWFPPIKIYDQSDGWTSFLSHRLQIDFRYLTEKSGHFL